MCSRQNGSYRVTYRTQRFHVEPSSSSVRSLRGRSVRPPHGTTLSTCERQASTESCVANYLLRPWCWRMSSWPLPSWLSECAIPDIAGRRCVEWSSSEHRQPYEQRDRKTSSAGDGRPLRCAPDLRFHWDFHVERKGSIPSHFQEKVLHRNRLGSRFHVEPYAKRSHSINCSE